MTDPGSDDRLNEELRHLRAQNRRYRELIQNLSSRVEIIRDRTKEQQIGAGELRAFENFDAARRRLPKTLEFNLADVGRSKVRTEGRGDSIDLKPLVPNPGWKCLAVDQPQIRIGFTLFGMHLEAVEEAVAVVEKRQVRSMDFTPVFVTDNTDFRPFRTRGYVVEYIPDAITSQAKNNRSLQQYLDARLELIQTKWALGEFVDLGHSS